MRIRPLLATAVLAVLTALLAGCGGTAATGSGGESVTVYSADGLGTWYQKRFAEFTKQTGIPVNYVEAGSGEVVSRVDKERTNPQADVLVTLPPFIQQAAERGLLQTDGVGTGNAASVPGRDAQGRYVPLVNNYPVFIVNPTAASPLPATWDDLLAPRFASKLQYSTPGQAGDGTAVLLQLQHVFGKQGALDYLAKLQANNVGPSSSTGKLQPKVSNGELAVANGDVQMNLQSIVNDKANFRLFFPADATGARSTFSLPYEIGLAVGAPHADAGRRLIDFLLSAPVQGTVGADAIGVPARADVKPTDPNTVKINEALQGVTIWQPDWDTVSREINADVTAYQQAVNK
ncbi:MAG TPA: 2-aminoethylphosphonate ABC transporter substrate-binding protein [Pseudonocardia sp.]|uniref:2-aminoethylphosphonate ABC transporter substrate-binding protein n=1 Tax=Pseudonocardia sp. TaxID=60912 RepID=UPI002CF97D0D|nr:2-aminoethylphosphonate ABC transporter substrate-binding protein [Pseudonocardia sp.]HTF53439.1 2-aminoethylphosphonate ABC transporter substrate-binding protein [Pseudonocardia sp.]